jgi:hypothetical protein
VSNKIEELAILHRTAMQDAAMLWTRYQEKIDFSNKILAELEQVVDEELTRRRDRG